MSNTATEAWGQDTARTLGDVLARFWMPPHELGALCDSILRNAGVHSNFVTVAGETDNITLYAACGESVAIWMPFAELDANPVLRDLQARDLAGKHFVTVSSSERLQRRLAVPRVLMTNLCVLDNFPVPRLSLSVGLPTAYLRRQQLADVRILDMQTGATTADIVAFSHTFRPALIGLSVSYGQLALAEEVLNLLDEHATDSGPLIILGNILPASFPDFFLRGRRGRLIALGEGEPTLAAICESLRDGGDIYSAPGLAFVDVGGRRDTPRVPLDIQNLPLPALDTLPEIARLRGALTLEISRGCQWNVCTFCPREHKSAIWKTLPQQKIVDQFSRLAEAAGNFGIAKHVFLADEEFVGGIDDGAETERMIGIARALRGSATGMRFDAAARVDQVYSPKMDDAWHIRRIEMWDACRDAGLDRLFMGLESGSDSQLRRYGKGIRAEQSVVAIRLLSALGIHQRFGFITFDQLMTGLAELKENITFLERRDAYLRVPRDCYSFNELFILASRDDDFVREYSEDKPILAGISYMLATMEVLQNSTYARLVSKVDPSLLNSTPDPNMGRYVVRFADPLIGEFSVASQEWIDRHFGVAYSVKSLYKTAPALEREHLMAWMIAHRSTSLALVKAFVWIFDPDTDRSDPHGINLDTASRAAVLEIRRDRKTRPVRDILHECMAVFDDVIGTANTQLQVLLANQLITDTADDRLRRALGRWTERSGTWDLINSTAFYRGESS